MSTLKLSGEGFSNFAMLYLDESGRFIDSTREGDISTVAASDLPEFFRAGLSGRLKPNTTDVFIWVHGWQNDEIRAITSARRLFANLEDWFISESAKYPDIEKMVPAFVAVHWPSTSMPGLGGYKKIRDRAKTMTTQGEAEFFLASLLGYLDAENERTDRKVLRSKGGHYIHCLGHSFGGRFLTAAIKAAAKPEARVRKLLAAQRKTGFPFNVDTLCVLQMAAGSDAFGSEFSELLNDSPMCGPIVLTHSSSDRALCTWHVASEFEAGIGCRGAMQPSNRIGAVTLKDTSTGYTAADFAKDITNVDASSVYLTGGWTEGGHSDFWHPQTLHLIASLVEQARR